MPADNTLQLVTPNWEGVWMAAKRAKRALAVGIPVTVFLAVRRSAVHERGAVPLTTKPIRRTAKRERLEARVTPEQKRLIERAAQLRGTSVTDFVLASVQQAAAETIKDFETLRLRDAAREVFVKAILKPPAPNEAARVAAARYKNHSGP